MLVIHGHQFDGSLNPNRLLPMIGSNAYARAQRIHDWYNRRCEAGDDEGRSLSDYIREPARKAIEFLTDFRDRAVLAAARDHKADGVICGHIHRSDHRLDRKRLLRERRRLGAEPDGAGRGARRRAANHPMARLAAERFGLRLNLAGGDCMTTYHPIDDLPRCTTRSDLFRRGRWTSRVGDGADIGGPPTASLTGGSIRSTCATCSSRPT